MKDGKILPRKKSGHREFTKKDLDLLWRIPFSKETELSKVEIALRERIKELNCFYGIFQLAEKHSNSINDLLDSLVDFLPYSWQFPEIARCRISFKEKIYKSKKFKMSKWRMASQIQMYGEPVGSIEIFYIEESPPFDEGPFLKEERALLDALAKQVGAIAARISAENELQESNRQLIVEQKALQESNMALRAVLSRIEDEKKEIHRDISANVEKILMPILHALALESSPAQRKYVEMLKTNLEEIASPFIGKLSSSYRSLSPTEINICNMIRTGMRTKEIAKMRGISESTVNRHRENIRRKLKITNDDVNLATYLQSEMVNIK